MAEEQKAVEGGETAEKMEPLEARPQGQHPIPELGTPDDASPPRGKPFPIVGIGASAGGIEAAMQLWRELPANTGMAFIYVQHLEPHHTSELPTIFSGATAMPVVAITNGMKIEPNKVFVLPPNALVTLNDGELALSEREHGPHLPVDRLLLSLAAEQGGRSIAVILSGTDSDGSQGVQAIKGECGVTFAQEETSAKFPGMPRSAMATGAIDFVLTPAEIGRELARIASHPYVAPPEPGRPELEVLPDGEREIKRLFGLLQGATSVDFTHYKQTTVRRRIGRRMVVHRMKSLRDYVSYVQRNPAELKELFRDLLIVVTSFFREPETFAELRQTLMRTVPRDRTDPMRVWVPGCATGQEAYSLAICLYEALEEMRLKIPIQLFGTDISEFALARAREGVYTKAITQDVSAERLERFFFKVDAGYQITKAIRENCIFARQDLTTDPPFSHLDIVSCRNVLIYLDGTLQRKIIPIFHYSLKESGLLMLGSAEATGSFTELFEPLERGQRIYRRKAAPIKFTMDLAYTPPTATVATGDGGPPQMSQAELHRRVDRIMQERYAPGAVVVDSEYNIVEFRGHTSPYLDPTPGEASLNLLHMAKESLVVALRRGLKAAIEQNSSIRERASVFDRQAERRLTIEIIPIVGVGPENRYYLVVFEEREQSEGDAPEGLAESITEPEALAEQLRQELADSREALRNLREDHAAHMEELQAANEEVKSSNEELQSTNEELRTTKEELQSANEELTTVNEELRTRNQELSAVNSEMKNLLATVNIPLVIVDNDLRLRRFTDASERLMGLTAMDVGRRLNHMRGPFSPSRLEQIVKNVLATLHTEETEVQDDSGRWFSITARPFRTLENRIEGATLSFIDIDLLKRGLQAAEQARDYAEALVETVREPMVVLDADARVRRATSAFYEAFQVSREETEGRVLYDLGNGQWNIPRLRELLGEALFRNIPFQDFEIEHEFPYIGKRTMRLNGQRIPLGSEPRLVLLAIEDVTERREVAELRYRRLFETAKDAIVVVDAVSGLVLDVNPYTSDLTGYSRDRLVGKALVETEPFWHGDMEQMLTEARHGEAARREGVTLYQRDGREIGVDIVASLYTVGTRRVIQLNIRDVSDRRRAEAALRLSEQRFRLFVDSVSDYALLLMDTSGNVVSWNAGAGRLLGYREDEILGQSAALLFTPEDVEAGEFRRELDRALRDGRSEDERWHIRKDGSRFWGSGVVTLVRDEAGRLRGFAKVLRDHTERKRAEEALRGALNDKEVLLREIHHRVKNNLQVITSLLNIQAASAAGQEADALEQTRNRVRVIARIHELLYKSQSLGRIDMGEHTERLGNDLFEVYGVDRRRIRLAVAMEGIMVDIEHAMPVGLILNELISNSLKHAFPEGASGEVSVAMKRLDGEYRLLVKDNGVGMPAEVDLMETQTLGLRLVSIFVEQLQGKIVLSREGGTSYEIRFPGDGASRAADGRR